MSLPIDTSSRLLPRQGCDIGQQHALKIVEAHPGSGFMIHARQRYEVTPWMATASTAEDEPAIAPEKNDLSIASINRKSKLIVQNLYIRGACRNGAGSPASVGIEGKGPQEMDYCEIFKPVSLYDFPFRPKKGMELPVLEAHASSESVELRLGYKKMPMRIQCVFPDHPGDRIQLTELQTLLGEQFEIKNAGN